MKYATDTERMNAIKKARTKYIKKDPEKWAEYHKAYYNKNRQEIINKVKSYRNNKHSILIIEGNTIIKKQFSFNDDVIKQYIKLDTIKQTIKYNDTDINIYYSADETGQINKEISYILKREVRGPAIVQACNKSMSKKLLDELQKYIYKPDNNNDLIESDNNNNESNEQDNNNDLIESDINNDLIESGNNNDLIESDNNNNESNEQGNNNIVKDQITDLKQNKIDCLCGSHYLASNRIRHEKTLKHINAINNK